MKKPIYSYSRWKLYDQCPAKYKFKYIDKLPEDPPGPAVARGLEIHKMAEDYVNGTCQEFNPIFSYFEKGLDRLKNLYSFGNGFTEKRIEISNRDWAYSLQGIIDYQYINEDSNECTIIDYKTGNIYQDHADQGEFYCLLATLKDSTLESISSEFWYIDKNKILIFDFNPIGMLDKWLNRFDSLHNDTEYDYKENQYCKYCSYSKKRGGPCTI